jgi:hypothetical protein
MDNTYKDPIGLHVKYFSHIGEEMFGTIVHTEPCTNQNAPGYPFDYIYIEDEISEYNIHEVVNIAGQTVMYADIRPSYEVYPDQEEK